MRYSTSKPAKIGGPRKKSASAAELLEQVEQETTERDRRGGILLVGGTSARDIAVRTAQSVLRYDRLPSYWSHAALILDWPDGASPEQITGAEVSLEPERPWEQVPERDGVTLFRLQRYLDRGSYPNLAFGTLCPKDPEDEESVKWLEGKKDRIVSAALKPGRDPLRFRLWEWLGVWHAFVHGRAGAENPLAQGLPFPAAALCEYAYEAAQIDITPGATAPNACPELLWGTHVHWHDRLSERGIRLGVWAIRQKDESPGRKARSMSLEKDWKELRSGPG